MVHNGIEYGLMAAYGEGFDILHGSPYAAHLDLGKIAGLWNHGSVVRSWLLELVEDVFKKDRDLSGIRGYVEDSGEGRWIVEQAIESGIPAPVTAISLFQRFRSREEDFLSDKLQAALRKEFGGHGVLAKDKKTARRFRQMKAEESGIAGYKEKKLRLENLARLVRYFILTSTTEAGSGHPTSSLSAADLLVCLFFAGFFRYDAENPKHPNNDRLIFSKGHASPLFYSLWAAAGKISEQELMTYRRFGSTLEGHPTATFRYAEVATGSLGQGLSIGAGMALNAKYLDKLPYRTYVLLGDSEMAEGSQWEAMELAAYYKLNNLIGIIDVNRLGQRGETMYGSDTMAYSSRIRISAGKLLS